MAPGKLDDSHICLIWVDDLIDVYTWRDAFGLRIETPNLDRFMARATRFTNAYATVPLCAPCRAELATGISPFRSGLVDLNRFWRDVHRPEKAWQYDLRRAGFYTFTTGKVDSNYQPMPEEYRRILFHEEPEADDRGRRRGVHAYLDRGPGIKGVNHPDDDGSQDDRFYDWWVAQNAIDFLGRADPSRRTLIQLGFKHPHYNLICPDRFYAQYDPARIRWPDIAHADDYHGPQPGFAVYEAAYIANGQWTPEKAGDEAWRQVVRAYFAACSHVDHEIGRFLDALDASPFGAKTSVVFLSDNGFNLGNHDSFHKMSQWDSAAHVPLAIRLAGQTKGREIDLPVSLHNLPKTVMQLAGLPPRPDWTSGQSLLPLIDPEFGDYDETQSPVTSVFGTLSVRPSTAGLSHLRYFRYPNGEEHVYDIENDPGETENLVDTAPMETLRDELVRGALALGLDLRGHENPADGVNAMMAVDGTVMLEGGRADNHYWAYGRDAEKIREEKDGGTDTLWYMAGPDDYVLHCPANVEKIRIATVVSRSEADGQTGKRIRIVAHPDSPIEFETSERVEIDLTGSDGDDVMIGPKHGSATFYGGAGNDLMIARAKQGNRRHAFYGEAGNDTLHGGPGRDTLDGGTGDDVIYGNAGRNDIRGGHGNDVIHDGEGASTIDPGPGRNTVTLGPGDHEVTTGAGITRITAEEGAKTFRIGWGGVTVLTGWTPEQVYDLSAWPAPPRISRPAPGTVRLRAGLAIVDISDVPEDHDIGPQLRTKGT
ncbi:sulfatase-like hydrolase/transferase [Roseibacterium sp. SDUM158016]|uniref:sulfatase-like hydrolase/transferase n=1 Tax=Roseicyclus sediminis TaxID=2980997 RepID=UPI0021D05AC1|nr:sulfatase-like hydrolase/transferase [Roseibacterium sp. SDUM158016]MCU4653696.1 sulfatase-like hydrolase/transferase [Roseibacterium sp. SDUM158016]